MSQQSETRRDPIFYLLCGGVLATALWLLATPLVPTVARTTMHRFHLKGDSYARWAAQFPIPAMYNFSNEYEIRELPEDFFALVLEPVEPRKINHYPARVFTFASGRYRLLNPGQDRWVTLRSQYRGQTVESRFHLQPTGDGMFDVVREKVDREESDDE